MIRGWCPGVHEPMPSGDGLLVRVKPFGGILTAAGLRGIAAASVRYGNGVIELTSRGNLQIRGLTPATAPDFAADMVAAGLADPDPARERRRNVIPVPPCDDSLVAAIEAVLADLPGLAPKFCVAAGWAEEADLVVHDGAVWAEGRAVPCSRSEIPGVIRRLAAGAQGHRLGAAMPDPGGDDVDGLLLGLPFGQADAASLVRLADLAGQVRTTPWRSLYLPGGRDLVAFAGAGFITDRTDPRRTIAACPGAPACASGCVPARADAARLAAQGLTNIHVSGCSKGCAHPRAAVTLVGRAGCYDLVPNGRAADLPTFTGLTLAQAAGHLAAMRL
jgi:precorrin-3B synthase